MISAMKARSAMQNSNGTNRIMLKHANYFILTYAPILTTDNLDSKLIFNAQVDLHIDVVTNSKFRVNVGGISSTQINNVPINRFVKPVDEVAVAYFDSWFGNNNTVGLNSSSSTAVTYFTI